MNIKGRMNRATYWSGLALILSLLVVLRSPSGATGGLLAMMFGMSVARLHDTGRSGKWALPPFLLALAPLFLPFLPLGPLGSEGRSWIGAIVLLAPLFVLGAAAWLGSLPGQPDDNRFGPPPGPGVALFRSKPRSQVG